MEFYILLKKLLFHFYIMYEEIILGAELCGLAYAALEILPLAAKHESYSHLKSIKESDIGEHNFAPLSELQPEGYMTGAKVYLNPERIDDKLIRILINTAKHLPLNRWADQSLIKFLKNKTFEGKPALNYIYNTGYQK